jgi:hypothetical protein
MAAAPPRNQGTFYTVGTVERAFASPKGKVKRAFKLPTIDSAANPAAVADLKRIFEAAIAKDFRDAQKEVAEADEEYGSESSTSYQVVCQTNRVLVLQTQYSEYNEGAAHGQGGTLTALWDIAAQRKVTAPLLRPLTPAQTTALNRLIKRRLNARYSGNTFTSLAKAPLAGWFPDAQGIVLYWGEYQVGCYAYGRCDTPIPVAELKPYLDDRIKGLLGL